jgi:hypothetical protein
MTATAVIERRDGFFATSTHGQVRDDLIGPLRIELTNAKRFQVLFAETRFVGHWFWLT